MLRFIIALCTIAFLCSDVHASVTVTVNASNHTIPQTNEKGWGANVTAWIQAISQYTLQNSGGTFTLTAEVDTGSNYGFKVPYIKTQTSTPATAGVLRLARADSIGWRNEANGANLALGVDSSNRLTWNGSIVATAAGGGSFADNTFSLYDDGDATKLLSFQLSGISAGNTRTLTVPDSSGTIALTSGNVATATALASNPSDCAANNFATTIAANGDLTCAQPTVSNLAALTASRVAITDGSGVLSAADTATYPNLTELSYVKGVTSALCGISQSCTLTSKTLTDPIIDAVTFDDQSSTPASPSSGYYKFYVKTDGSAYVLNSSGVETAVGAGGGTNEQSEYITNGKFESATTGWATYGDAAASSPADGTGGSPSITFSRTTTAGEILKGTASGELVKGAVNEQGEGISYDFTVDYENYSTLRPVYIAFDYKTTSNYASGDVKVFVYDKDAAALLTVVDADNLSGALPASTTSRRFTGAFYPSTSTSNDYRLIFHITSTNATAYDMHVDSVHAGSAPFVPGAIITDWTTFTPTGSWSANSTYTGKWQRVGDSMEVQVKIALSGAPTSAGLTVNLPSGYTIDTAKLVSTDGTTGSLGRGTAADGGVATYFLTVHYNDTGSVAVYAMNAAATYAFHSTSQVTQALPFTFGNTDFVEVNFKVPISNWSSGASLSTTEMLQSSAVAQATGDPASVSSGNIVIFGTENYDNTSSYNTSTGQFTAPKTGRYRVHGAIVSANAGVGLFVYPNGSGASAIQLGSTDSNGEATFSGTISVSAGTTLDLRPNNTLDAAANSVINFEYVPDFSIFTQVPDTSDRIVRARINYSGGTPGVNASSPSNWISSLTDNGTAGDTTINVASGIFSSSPNCTCTVENPATGNMRGCKLYSVSSTAIRTITTDMSSTGADEIYQIICIGAR